MKFNIITLGCKVNTYESETIKELLLAKNFLWQEKFNQADIVIINTCSVTNTADSKSQKIVRKVKRENPDALLVVCGCSTQNNQEIYQELGIDILIGNQQKSQLGTLIENHLRSKNNYCFFANKRNLEFENMSLKKFISQTRAFIKIQDGCNNFCSFCIIPYVRGNVRSKDFNNVLTEAKTLVENHHYEIVLTGIHTGSYYYNGHDLGDLINELSKIEKLQRIRISSIEITELNDKFLTLLKNNKKVCSHLHIPLQSGSDEILKKMNRKYNLAFYEEKIRKIREIRPDISITTDVIVGFPFETLDLFQNTCVFCQKLKFSKIHVFPYSLRTGTVASTMLNQVKAGEKAKRSAKLIEISNQLEKEYYQKFLHQTVEVLIETNSNNQSMGHTANYLKVIIQASLETKKFYQVKIIDLKDNYAIGIIS